MVEVAERMFASLPAVFRGRDETGDLARLLGILEVFFFTGGAIDHITRPGLEQYVDDIPALFSPTGTTEDPSQVWRTPDRFMHWLASWLSFTPHSLFSPEQLRRIVAGIVPMYGFRGTRDYLIRLLELCFGNDVSKILVDDRPRVGFTIGESMLGLDTRLAVSRPFCFTVVVEVDEGSAAHESAALQQRLRAVIDFAKPAHTTYEFECRTRHRSTANRDGSPVSNGAGN